ncbi:PIG-M-domain-containing protein [Naematelia encephala]|uniref:GPI mannosyltransferase 1 n=1 Tax=Naematelia encephala TaxID=71784 RepID=A0A1Y2ASQ5_9TREE|nr:PIG-M-domain-containing protein [Naematelia encephala]
MRLAERRALSFSLIIQLGLIFYADHVDSHPERYGGLKYTDVDWRVVTDGTWLIFHPSDKNRAAGWLTRVFDLPIGDPYNRPTFRYTPLLPLLVSPHLLHPILGKLTLVLVTILVPIFLPSSLSTKLLWTLNPFVLNITTRGSPEAPVLLLVVVFFWALKRGRNDLTAIAWAVSVAWKIYPIIYAPVLWGVLSRKSGWFGTRVWRFGVIALGTFIFLNGILWSIWGYPFLKHTFLYHLTRLDHRHNFSPYFYPIYLALSPVTSPSAIQTILHHPLASFVPQFGLVGLAGFLLNRYAGLELAVFVQTASFVVFNKVCTSQYFTWFLPLLPPLLPYLHITPRKASLMIGLWVLSQAIWLGSAYLLELRAQDVYITVWAAGIALFGTSCWVLGEVIEGFELNHRVKPSSTVSIEGKSRE